MNFFIVTSSLCHAGTLICMLPYFLGGLLVSGLGFGIGFGRFKLLGLLGPLGCDTFNIKLLLSIVACSTG